MTFKKLGLIMAALALVGCNETLKIEDGRVPQEFLPYAQALSGEFRGSVEGRPNALTFSLDGDRFVASLAEDFVMAGCDSKIGALKEIRYSGKLDKGDVEIVSAVFEFDPANCRSIEGRELLVDGIKKADGKISFNTSVLSETYVERVCRPEVIPPYPPYGGGVREVCETHVRSFYINGRFSN